MSAIEGLITQIREAKMKFEPNAAKIEEQNINSAKQAIRQVTASEVANAIQALDSEKMDIDDCIFIPENLCKNFIFEVAKVPSA
jgi:hypothetical protein